MPGNRQGGSVSIFLCSILLILLVFCCSIVDITRIHVAQIQAERALQLASQSILGSYDSQLSSQYGIFAKDFSEESNIRNNIYHYIDSTLNPTNISEDSNFLMQSLFQWDTPFNLYNYKININNINQKQSLVSMNSDDYIKLQILEFMKYRAPQVAIEPFLQQIGMISKASKTSEVLVQKNEIAQSIGLIESELYELQRLIEGIEFDEKGTIVLDSTGQPSIYNNYIKRLITADNYESPIYTYDMIPNYPMVNQLNNNAHYIDTNLLAIKSNMQCCEKAIANIFEKYRTYKEKYLLSDSLDQQINALVNEYQSLWIMEDYEGRAKDLETLIFSISMLRSEKQELLSTLKILYSDMIDQALQFNIYQDNLWNFHMPCLGMLVDEYNESDKLFGYIGIHEMALEHINNIKSLSLTVQDDINSFKEMLENKDNQYIEETCESIREELKDYENRLGLNTDDDTSIINNIHYMDTIIEDNLILLKELEYEINDVINCKTSLETYWFNQNVNVNDEYLIQEILNLKDEQNENIIQVVYDNSIVLDNSFAENIIALLDTIEMELDYYSRDLQFDFSAMATSLDKDFNYEDFVDAAGNMLPGIPFVDKYLMIVDDNLPSNIISTQVHQDSEEVSETIDIERSNNFLESFQKLGNMMSKFLTDVRDTVYVNEYIIGMFKSATDNIKDVNNQKKENLTLNNFSKDLHYLDYEVEYVLFGDSVDYVNLVAAISVIFGIRVALNIIHLVSDMDKMNIITNIANAIAGWWTLGVGSIIITIVLTLIWAIAESIADIKTLLDGEKVPLLKNKMTWETDIFNGIVGLVVDNADSDNEQSLMPSLSYNDYLRLLLLIGWVDEETKLYRILDLIQMNMAEERNDEINLETYLSSYEINASFEINYIFFNMPFMPDNIKALGGAYTFESEVLATY